MSFVDKKIYAQIVKNSVIVTIDILCIYNHQLLLGLRNNNPLKGIYYMPGGRIFKGESLSNAFSRKSKEELGLELSIEKAQFLGIFDDFYEDSIFEGISSHCMPCTYLYHLSEAEKMLLQVGDDQHSEIVFFNIDDSALHIHIKQRIGIAKEKGYL